MTLPTDTSSFKQNVIKDNTVPVGTIIYVASETPPDGYLVCDGSYIKVMDYKRLYNKIGTVFGKGDGSTTFNIPDLRGEFIRGWDNGRGIDISRIFGSYQDDAFESHTHTVPEGHPAGGNGIYTSGDDMTPRLAAYSTSGATGGLETRPRNIALLPCIKY